MRSRGYDPCWIWQGRALATSAGALFIRSYERGERVYQAMVARGYEGQMPAMSREPTESGRVVSGMVFPALAWAAAIVALFVS